MTAVAASPIPHLVVLEGGRAAEPATTNIVALEGAWIEVQAIAHEAETFASLAVDAARRIQVAIARGSIGLAGQFAHELETAAPRYAHRARRSEIEAQQALDRLNPEPAA